VKLLLDEPGSDTAASLFDSSTELFSASVGYVEARAALSKANRAGRLPNARLARSRLDLEEIWTETTVVGFGELLVERAGDVAESHRLAAGDAIHLASALTLGEPELVFAVWDKELARAARESGLAVAP